MKLRVLAFAIVTSALPLAVSAQSAPQATPSPPPTVGAPILADDPCTSISAIVTRPTVTNSVCTVRPNHVLIETGYQNTSAAGGGNTVAYPQALLRIGTDVRGLEAFIVMPGVQRISSGASTVSGLTDVAAGLKYVIGATPKFAYGAQAQVSAPTGSAAFSANATTAVYALNLGYTISPVFSLGSTLSAQSLSAAGQRYASFVPSLTLTASLPSGNSVFGEIAEFTHANGPATATRSQYLLGLYHVFGQRLQADVEAGFSPTVSTGKYHYTGLGISYYL
jgi:hypothetical protein